jgi:hypothetical protein
LAGVKPPGCKADQSPPSNAEVENEWSYNDYSSIRCYTYSEATLLFRAAKSYFNMFKCRLVTPVIPVLLKPERSKFWGPKNAQCHLRQLSILQSA